MSDTTSMEKPSEKDQIISALRALEPELRTRYRARDMALFGSVVRGTAGPASDIDILVDLEESASLFDLIGLALFLEEKLQRRVDVVPRRSLRAEIRDAVLREAVAV